MLAPVAAVPRTSTQLAWPDAVDEILGGDLVAAVGTATEQEGVALCCVAPIGLRDRERGTVSFTSPTSFGRKLERLAADPRIAVAYHTRQHGLSDHPGYVLVQGIASLRPVPSGGWFVEQVARYDPGLLPPRSWDRWLADYYRDRMVVTVAIRRVMWWPGDVDGRPPLVLGAAISGDQPPSQPPPGDAGRARIRTSAVVRSARRGHRLLAVMGPDGLPLILPFDVVSADRDDLMMSVGSPILPLGARRAGVLAHGLHPRLEGFWIATHTGWLRVAPTPQWTPHTRHVLYAVPNRTLIAVGSGLATRWRHRRLSSSRADTPTWSGSRDRRGVRRRRNVRSS